MLILRRVAANVTRFGFQRRQEPIFAGVSLGKSRFSTENEKSNEDNRYRLASAVIVERTPIIMPEPTALEKAYELYSEAVRHSYSKVPVKEFDESNIGVAVNPDREAEKLLRENPINLPSNNEEKDRDLHSVKRKMSTFLYLLVKKPRDNHAWKFPQGGVETKESLRKAAERELKEECGTHMSVYFASNSPSAHYFYEFPPSSKSDGDYLGSHVFFYRAMYLEGLVQLNKRELCDFVWVTKSELKDYVDPAYYEAVKDVLFE